jgi:hypothetical protein
MIKLGLIKIYMAQPDPAYYQPRTLDLSSVVGYLARHWNSSNLSGSSGKGDLSITAANQSRHDLSTGVDPQRKLLSVDNIGIFQSIEAVNKRGCLHVAGADIVSPGDECTVLVLIQNNRVSKDISDGILERLFCEILLANPWRPLSFTRRFYPIEYKIRVYEITYNNVAKQELGCSFVGQREWEWDFGAVEFLA